MPSRILRLAAALGALYVVALALLRGRRGGSPAPPRTGSPPPRPRPGSGPASRPRR